MNLDGLSKMKNEREFDCILNMICDVNLRIDFLEINLVT